MIDRREVPILEFDEDQDAIICPYREAKRSQKNYPKRLIITFFKDVITKLLQEKKIELFDIQKGENDLIIYQFRDSDTLIIHGTIGGPAAGGFLDQLIGCGITFVMFCGGGGVLDKEITVGKWMVVSGAIRDEGLSYHYVAPSRIINTNPIIRDQICNHLDAKKVDYLVGLAWTTDAFFRETKARIALRKEEGAVIVEMEQAGLIAVCQFRGVDYGAILYGGDDVSGTDWDKRGWHSRSDVRFALVMTCKEIIES